MTLETLVVSETETLVVEADAIVSDVAVLQTLEIVTAGPQGAPGTPGAPGSAEALTLPAGDPVGGHRVLALFLDGTVRHADMTAANHADMVVGISNGAANAGANVSVSPGGLLVEPSWAWAVAGPVYATGLGLLTQTPPAAPDVFSLKVGVASSATSILVQIGTPVFLGA